jgi:D-aspartate ligase
MYSPLEPSSKRRVAIVLNMGPNGLGVARSLGHMGIPVVGMDFEPRPAGFQSKYVRPVRCPDPVIRPDELLDLLLSEGKELGEKGVLFACTDAFINFVSKNRSEISKWFELTIPPEDVIEGLIDKRTQYGWATRLGIPIPDTFFPKSLKEVRELRGQVRFPSFIKPMKSHLWSRTFFNKGFIVRDQQQLEERFGQVDATGLEAMVQKVLMPPGENIRGAAAYFGRNGYASPIFTWEKTRQDPPNFGVGSCVRSRWFPDIAEMSKRFAQGIGFLGTGSIGFKLDPDDGVWKLIEMNGRSWMQNHHATACGLNLPLLQYLDSLGLPQPTLNGFEEGVVWWDPLADFTTFLRLHRRGRIDFTRWVRSWFPPDVWAYYERGDAMPAWGRSRFFREWAMTLGAYLKMKEDPDAAWEDLGRG